MTTTTTQWPTRQTVDRQLFATGRPLPARQLPARDESICLRRTGQRSVGGSALGSLRRIEPPCGREGRGGAAKRKLPRECLRLKKESGKNCDHLGAAATSRLMQLLWDPVHTN